MNSEKKLTSQKKGTILVSAVIFGSLLIMTTGVLLKFSVTEKRINERHFLRLEAQSAAETAVEYGFAELQKRWVHNTSFTEDELTENQLSIPSSASTFFSGSHVNSNSLSVTGGQVPNGQKVYIDPDDPANFLDPQKYKRLLVRDVLVYGMATASPPTGMSISKPISAYTVQTLQVRDSSLFSHAIFYNMDLEFHPGANMDIKGPVYANGNIYLETWANLKFHSTLSSSKKIIYGYKKSGTITQNGSVWIKNASGVFMNMQKSGPDKSTNASDYYQDSMGEEWRDAAIDRWDGMVGSQAHEVPYLKLVDVDDYVQDDASTSDDETRNHAYVVIEPQLASSDPDYKGADIQTQQYSYKAGLLIRIEEDPTDVAGTDQGYIAKLYRYKRASISEPNSHRILDANGKPTLEAIDTSLFALDDLIKIENKDGTLTDQAAGYPSTYGSTILYGMYDDRQNVALTTVDIDVGMLRDLIDPASSTYVSGAWNGTYEQDPALGGRKDWNGVVYVETPYSASASGREDKIRSAVRDVAVRLVNGKEIPNPSSAIEPGFTLATNAPIYVVGSYNADGIEGTGGPTGVDDSDEPPASIIADTITVLSDNWESGNYDAKSKKTCGYRPAAFTEVSAAFLTGQSPTVIGGNTSGGVHNFPRFLEDWEGEDFRYRGSMVALFESEVHDVSYGSNYSWYKPPARKWGYHDLFKAGIYPPGSPKVRDFRRRDFKFLTKGEYDTAVAALTTP